MRQILAKSSLGQVISEKESEINLLLVNYADIETKLNYSLKEILPEKKSHFRFVVGIPSVIGGEERLARIIDYLHTQSKEIVNLSRSECFNFRTSLVD